MNQLKFSDGDSLNVIGLKASKKSEKLRNFVGARNHWRTIKMKKQ